VGLCIFLRCSVRLVYYICYFHWFLIEKFSSPLTAYSLTTPFCSIFPCCYNPDFTSYDQHLNTPSVGRLPYSWFKCQKCMLALTFNNSLFLCIFNTFPSTILPRTYTLYSCQFFHAPQIHALYDSRTVSATSSATWRHWL